jgi:hypothetical protein
MAKEYTAAPDVEKIARKLITDHHDHLTYVRIEYVFISEPAKSRGKVVWGRAKKVSGLNAWLATPKDQREGEPQSFFVMEIAKPIWLKLKEEARRALVDHELCHFSTDEDNQPTLISHDLEEFISVVRRHGLWRPEIEFFVEAGQQGKLFDIEKRTDALIEDMDRAAEARGFDKVTMSVNGEEHDITAAVLTGPRRIKREQ